MWLSRSGSTASAHVVEASRALQLCLTPAPHAGVLPRPGSPDGSLILLLTRSLCFVLSSTSDPSFSLNEAKFSCLTCLKPSGPACVLP